MKRFWLSFCLAVVVLLFASTLAAQTKSASAGWKTPTFHGITPGKSRKADVIKAFGQPNETRKPSLSAFAGDSCCEELVYKGKGDTAGDLMIAVRRAGPVVYIVDSFQRAMTRTTAHKTFGPDWHDRTYSTAKCAASGGGTPLYRDRDGNLELAEYPSKGLLLWPSDDALDYFGVVYLAKEPGLPKPPACVAKQKTETKKN